MKQIIYSLLASVILLASCSKKDGVPAKNEKKLVKTSMDFGDNTDYVYDESGRLTKTVSGNQEVTFTYSGNKVVEKRRIISLNETVIELTWTLNDKGLAVSGEGFFFMPVQKSASLTNTFNAEGQLTRTDVKVGANIGYMEYYYSNGDLMEIKNFDNNSFTRKSKYYYPAKIANKLHNGAGEMQSLPGINFMGKGNQHLVERSEEYDQSGTLTNSAEFQYVLDADGYPAQRKINNDPNIFYYHYN